MTETRKSEAESRGWILSERLHERAVTYIFKTNGNRPSTLYLYSNDSFDLHVPQVADNLRLMGTTPIPHADAIDAIVDQVVSAEKTALEQLTGLFDSLSRLSRLQRPRLDDQEEKRR